MRNSLRPGQVGLVQSGMCRFISVVPVIWTQPAIASQRRCVGKEAAPKGVCAAKHICCGWQSRVEGVSVDERGCDPELHREAAMMVLWMRIESNE